MANNQIVQIRSGSKNKSSGKKKSKSKKSKTTVMQPAARYLRYVLPNVSAGATNTYYIDLANDLSKLNRRLYRQGRDYHVKRVTIMSAETISGVGWTDGVAPPADMYQQNAGLVRISGAPDGWVTRNAWKRGFASYDAMNKAAMRTVASDVKGTWADYKVYLNNGHRTGTIAVPKDLDDNDILAGEWVYSKYVSPDQTTTDDEYTAHLLGGHIGAAGNFTSIGLIESYGLSRPTVVSGSPNEPGTPMDTDPLNNLLDFGEVNQEILENVRSDNDIPPYNVDEYIGDASNLPAPQVLGMTTLGSDGRGVIPSFSAVCGLLRIDTKSPTDDDGFEVLIELAAGSYRGIKAEAL
ncbi:MAG: hypothetical protein [Cressdnaviricota sp.]|nr:MAG: hypothetical protein [Cressdnaviricota sp.]